MKRPRNMIRFALFAVLLFALISSSVVVQATDPGIDGKSSLVVDGDVKDVQTQGKGNSVESYATIVVRKVHKGNVKEKDVRVKYLGGEFETGKGMLQSDQPSFAVEKP